MEFKVADMDLRSTHELLMSCIVPRPIALVSTIGNDGVFNLAPFSTINNLCLKPAIVCFTISSNRDNTKKDTLVNIENTKEFVVNVVTEELAEPMNQASARFPSSVDEFKEVGLTPVPATAVRPPLVSESPVNIECKLHQLLTFGEGRNLSTVVIGEVILVHVKDDLWTGEYVDPVKFNVISRIGGFQYYSHTNDIFQMQRPTNEYNAK